MARLRTKRAEYGREQLGLGPTDRGFCDHPAALTSVARSVRTVTGPLVRLANWAAAAAGKSMARLHGMFS